METTEATTTNNPVLAEGVRRCGKLFTQEKYGHHNFTEQERSDVLDFAHGEVVRWLQATGSLTGFDAAAAVDHSLSVVLCQREPKPEVKTYPPNEWTLGTVTLVLTDKLFEKVKELVKNEIRSLADMVTDYPEDEELREKHQEGIEALRDFEAAAKQ